MTADNLKEPGCAYVFAEKFLPLVSVVGGWAGLDRAVIGDYMTAGRKMAVMFAFLYCAATFGERHVYTFITSYIFMYGWISDIVWTRRDYRAMHGVATNGPKSGRAVAIAAVLGLTGLDRFYINDRVLGALKLSLLVAVSSQPSGVPDGLLTKIEHVMYCWYACDIVLSPLRARLQ